jgi:nucleolar protein TMA23
MDAQAYLIRHGWSGPGNPLNPNQRPGPHGGLGLTKPILVARKQNNHGVGKKTTKDPTNQWWLRGFEDALKGFGEEKTTDAGSNNALTSELYRHFVRGECLAGTIKQKTVDEPEEMSKPKSKRKRDSEDEDERRAKKEEKAARKQEKRKRRKVKGDEEATESATMSSSDSSSEKRKESKEERRLRKKEKKERKERKAEEKKLKKAKRSASEEDYPTPMSTDEDLDNGRLNTVESDEASPTTKEKKEKKESKKSKSKNKDSEGEPKSDTKKSKKEKKEKKEKFA